MAAYFETAAPVKRRFSGVELTRSNNKSEGIATLGGERKPFRVFCVTLCVTRLLKNGQIPDDVRRRSFPCKLLAKGSLRS